MEVPIIQRKIYEIRGHKIMLDFDLAILYEVETRVLNQATKGIWIIFRMILCFASLQKNGRKPHRQTRSLA